LVEHAIENRSVAGSIPALGTTAPQFVEKCKTRQRYAVRFAGRRSSLVISRAKTAAPGYVIGIDRQTMWSVF
jgi:hypothetical protein